MSGDTEHITLVTLHSTLSFKDPVAMLFMKTNGVVPLIERLRAPGEHNSVDQLVVDLQIDKLPLTHKANVIQLFSSPNLHRMCQLIFKLNKLL